MGKGIKNLTSILAFTCICLFLITKNTFANPVVPPKHEDSGLPGVLGIFITIGIAGIIIIAVSVIKERKKKNDSNKFD